MTTQPLFQMEIGGLIPTSPLHPYEVRPISNSDTHWLLLNVHYAKRIPSISYSYGLYKLGELVGVVTYGMPASPSLCKGVCGEEYKDQVLELNRLCLVNNEKGEASRLVGGSLRLLPKPLIIVSYADTSQEHTGIVYQATNFIYTGSTIPRTEMAIRGMEHLHSKAIANQGNKEYWQNLVGDRLYWRDRAVKHRYIYFLGNKKEVKEMKKALKYPPLPYPKGEKE